MASSIDVVVYNATTETYEWKKVSKWQDYSKHLGCRTFDIVAPNDQISIYVDDEGFMVEGNPLTEVTIDNRFTQLAGNLLFAGGTDENGDTLPFVGTIEDLKKMVSSTDLEVGYAE